MNARRQAGSWVMLFAIFAGGCGAFVMEPPGHSAARLAAVPTGNRATECPIFVVTDRDSEPRQLPHVFFKNKPSYLVSAAEGVVRVDRNSSTAEELWHRSTRGPGISPQLDGLDTIGTLWSVVPNRHATTNPSDSRDARMLASKINAMLDRLDTSDVVVFVHGYNTELSGNAAILAGLWHYSGQKFVPIAFEWPSDVDLLGYTIDKQNAARSTRALRLLIDMLAKQTKATRINILAHSAGTAVALSALHQLRLSAAGQTKDQLQETYRIGSVILAAPDVDTVEYLNIVMDGMLDLPERLTIYMSSHDLALKISRWLFGNNRLGFISSAHVYSGESTWLAKMINSTAIDVAPALKHYPSDWIGHSYFYSNPIVSEDVMRALLTPDSPKERGLKIDPKMPGIWTLPEYQK